MVLVLVHTILALLSDLFIFIFFFYWHYNPIWVLAFSVTFFHSVLSLLSFLHRHRLEVFFNVFFSLLRIWDLFREGSPVLFTEFFATL
jgi:O-antigen/teichoic acid export membrane protein